MASMVWHGMGRSIEHQGSRKTRSISKEVSKTYVQAQKNAATARQQAARQPTIEMLCKFQAC
jgi:hypothetical protein